MRAVIYVQHSCTIHEHRLEVPLNHSKSVSPTSPKIEILTREIIRPGGEKLPYLVFLQGGLGGKGPHQGDFHDGWISGTLKEFRVVLLDQRGAGQSTRMDWQALQELPDDRARADHLMLFRQGQTTKDAEAFHAEITDGAKQTILRQSYDGFLTLAYLSVAPETVEASLVTGDLPGLVHVDDIYRLNYEKTAARNYFYFSRYPGDKQKIRGVVAHIRDIEEPLPTGERPSSERLRMIGMGLGIRNRTDMLHYLLEDPFVTLHGERRLSLEFLESMAAEVTINPMYGVLQEAIYTCTTPELTRTAIAWSAGHLAGEVSGFAKDVDPLDASESYYLTGGHTMCRISDEDPAFAPLAGASDIPAARADWPMVYSPERLAANEVPIAAAIYEEDMFVPRELSLATARAVRDTRAWIANEYQHGDLCASSGRVFARLLGLLRG